MLNVLILEIKRYYYLTYKNFFKTIFLNFLIFILFYIFFKNTMSNEYIIIYSIVWLFMSSQMICTKDLTEDYKNNNIKYYTNQISKVYFIRYLLHCLKLIITIYLLLIISYSIHIINFRINFLDSLVLFLGLLSIYLPSLLFAIFTVLFNKLYTVINIFRVLLLYIIASSENIFLPLSYSIKLITDKFVFNIYYNPSNIFPILLNCILYTLLGYLISSKIIWSLRYKLL